MAVPLADLFKTDHPDWGAPLSPQWNCAVFERAYYHDGGSFSAVCGRIANGFSVLVYLPGKCMAAAASCLKLHVPGQWKEQGTFSEKSKTITEVWAESSSMFESIRNWFGGDIQGPKLIYQNLDFLTDGRGAMDPSYEAKTALLYLTETARSGVLLGLSDRGAGELPGQLTRPFDEEVWLDEVPYVNFTHIIPRRLGEKLGGREGLPDGWAWLIFSRLRWTDPIRAVKIMDDVSKDVLQGGIGEALKKIMAATRTVEFNMPEGQAEGDLFEGFEKGKIDLLKTHIINPYEEWSRFTGDMGECQQRIRRLQPGLILYGPPGTGKSTLARLIATKIGLPVRRVSAADLKRGEWGQTERLVRELSRSARRSAPCVIVLDDADDLLPDRQKVQEAGGSVASAEQGVVNAFLQELSGYGGRLEGVLWILTTNRFEWLDKAARARLPIHIRIPYPLDREQVGKIVKRVAKAYGLDLGNGVQAELVNYFMGPLVQGRISNTDDRNVRYNADEHLFSPREIETAMRLLAGHAEGKVTLDNVKAMKKSHESSVG